MGTPLKGALSAGGVGKNHNFGRIAGYRSMTGGVQTTTATVHRTVYCTDDHASVTLFITTSMDDHDKENRFELYAAINLKQNLCSTVLYY